MDKINIDTNGPPIVNPFPINYFEFYDNQIYCNYLYCKFITKALYFQELRTVVTNAPKYKDFKQYTCPYYYFKFYDINNPKKLLKTYTYEELFNLTLIASTYGTPYNIPNNIIEELGPIDLQLIILIDILLPVLKTENSVMLANQYRQNGLKYFYTFTIPDIFYQSGLIPSGQANGVCYADTAIITLARNAPTIVKYYEDQGIKLLS